jgi:hypothetical protein
MKKVDFYTASIYIRVISLSLVHQNGCFSLYVARKPRLLTDAKLMQRLMQLQNGVLTCG